MEVVVYDLRFTNQDEWVCDWRSVGGIKTEQIGYDYLSLYSWNQLFDAEDDPEYRYARYPRVDTDDAKQCRQHHFWFRFDKTILDIENAGVKHVGDFVISGCANKFLKGRTDESSYHASVYVDSSKVKKGRILHTLGMAKKESYSQCNFQHVQRPRQVESRTFRRTNAIIHVPPHQRKFKKKELLPETREVAINVLQAASLEEGCKVLSAIPSATWQPDDYDSYDGDYADGWYSGYGHGNGKGIIPYHKHRGAMD
jgi:hypothetical protein